MATNYLTIKPFISALCAALLFFGFQAGYAQTSAKLTIIDQDYEQAKLESKKQHKLLLIDFFTTWCVPCKYLDEAVFKNANLSEELAKNFVVLKYDAEKDKNHQLSLKYHIRMYPSAVVLNENKLVVNRMYGTGGSDKDMTKNYMAFINTSIENHSRKNYIKGVSGDNFLNYPKFYEEYVYHINKKDVDQKFTRYWQNNPDHFDEVTFSMLCYFDGGSDEMANFFSQNKKKYEDLYGELDVRWVNSMILSKKVYAALDAKDRKLFNEAKDMARLQISAKDTVSYFLAIEQQMLKKEQRWADAANVVEQRMQLENYDPESTNDFCWSIYQECNDQHVLLKCSSWMKKLAKRSPSYNTLDTYARLLYKTGNKKLAIATIQKAIKLGKANKEDTRSSEDWLKKNI
ncbi:thioredoxin family protein [Pedobacter terrae]|uniref:thioredoxin family protein n=1 Tax=Pedobacter terrae TaxID=405671 RepID=UPI002FF4C018